MKTLIVGGSYGDDFQKDSGVVYKMAKYLDADIINGGKIFELEEASKMVPNYDLVFWMPDIDNNVPDFPIVKKTGAVLIVSKAIRDNTRSRSDAIQRIFKFHGNAVIAITYNQNEKFSFELIDALGNAWYNGTDLESLVIGVKELTEWTNNAKREGTLKARDELDDFIVQNRRVSDTVTEIQERYFGNLSTRCSKLFPSKRESNSIMVSRRNVNKKALQREDMVEAFIDKKERIRYFGEHKPSVDTPVQIKLYEMYPDINFMIHGHNFVKGAPITKEYFPCGDMREIPHISTLIDNLDKKSATINLLNHGFLIYAESLEALKEIINSIEFEEM